MEKYKPTVTLFLDQRVQKKSGKFPLKLTIYCKPKKKLFKTDIDLTIEEWKKVNSEKLRDENLKKIQFKMNALKNRAASIIEDLIPFSFRKFDEAFYQNAIDLNSHSLSNLFDSYIDKKNNEGSVGSALTYRTTLNSLLEFNKNLSIFDITVSSLSEYESFMLGKKKSSTTIGIYLRTLRSIYNDSISRNIISRDNYPFGKNKYVIPVGSNTKKALSNADINLLLNHIPNNIEEQKALDFWKLSYFLNGMNFCDILQLKPEDIDDNYVSYIRAKTKNTRKGTQQKIRIHILPEAWEIINKWKSIKHNSVYIFPFLKEESTPIQKKYFIQGFIKKTNKYMEDIRIKLEISQKCNTYSCRHSFATVLKRGKASLELISESLGHSSILTTRAYLDSFDDKTKVEVANLLVNLV